MLRAYYSDPAVRSRLIEFLGGSSLEEATAAFISSDRGDWDPWYNPRPVSELLSIAASGGEVARSLWDGKSLVAHLDMEYVNFDDQAEPYLHPLRAFEMQRPVVTAVQELLLGYGIAPLHILSGRGHHFVWRIDLKSPTLTKLAQSAYLLETIRGKCSRTQPPKGERIPGNLAAAFAGLGQVMEYLAHLILQSVGPISKVPIELTAVEVGPIQRGREIISIDLSEYGDPLYTRTTRMPFSVYLKPSHCRVPTVHVEAAPLPPLFVIPLYEMDQEQGLATMRDTDEVIKLAARASVQIPEQARGTLRLLDSYRQSRLARFHEFFYSAEHDPPSRWCHTYDRTPLEALPACVSRILRYPNDLLLKPAGVQHVARALVANGWHPRHIAGLIRSKYERDYGWGPRWFTYDAAQRADFYTRLFCGLLADGLDPLIDFNCKSTQEKGYCCTSGCGEILEQHRLRLVDRSKSLQAESAAAISGDHSHD
jgi:hypothetical protein